MYFFYVSDDDEDSEDSDIDLNYNNRRKNYNGSSGSVDSVNNNRKRVSENYIYDDTDDSGVVVFVDPYDNRREQIKKMMKAQKTINVGVIIEEDYPYDTVLQKCKHMKNENTNNSNNKDIVLELDQCSFLVKRKLGSGAFASVFLVDKFDRENADDPLFALKLQNSVLAQYEYYIQQSIERRFFFFF